MFFQRTQQSRLEARLKHGRPVPEDELVDEIVSYIDVDRPVVRTRGLRAAFVAATVGVAVALATFGGVTYAASSVEHAAVAVKHVFVAKKPARATKPRLSVDVLNALRPGKTSAADQYLPPGITPLQALTSFSQYVTKANEDLQSALNCGAKSGKAKTACTNQVNSLKTTENQDRTTLNAAATQLAALPPAKLALIGVLLAIHLQQQQKLAAGQTTRASNCANATYKSAHKAICAKVTAVTGATERLKLGHLELPELTSLLASV